MEFDDTTRAITSSISKETGIVQYEVERAVSMFFKGIHVEVIQDNNPIHVRMPFLGVLFPNKKHSKKINEANNIGGGLSCIQPGSTDDKGIQDNS